MDKIYYIKTFHLVCVEFSVIFRLTLGFTPLSQVSPIFNLKQYETYFQTLFDQALLTSATWFQRWFGPLQ